MINTMLNSFESGQESLQQLNEELLSLKFHVNTLPSTPTNLLPNLTKMGTPQAKKPVQPPINRNKATFSCSKCSEIEVKDINMQIFGVPDVVTKVILDYYNLIPEEQRPALTRDDKRSKKYFYKKFYDNKVLIAILRKLFDADSKIFSYHYYFNNKESIQKFPEDLQNKIKKDIEAKNSFDNNSIKN